MIIRKWYWFLIVIIGFYTVYCQTNSNYKEVLSKWQRSWNPHPSSSSWSVENQIAMTTENVDYARKKEGRLKVRKQLRRFVLPLLLAYKLKFFTLIPILVGGLMLLTTTTGIAGFFFALFAASMGLKNGGYQ